MLSIQEALGSNSYPGRGILIGRNTVRKALNMDVL